MIHPSINQSNPPILPWTCCTTVAFTQGNRGKPWKPDTLVPRWYLNCKFPIRTSSAWLPSYSCTGCSKGNRWFLKCIMLATAKEDTAGTMPFASLPYAPAVAMKHATLCIYCWNVFFNGNIVLKVQRIFHTHFTTGHHGKSSLQQCHTVMGRKVMTEFFRIKKRNHQAVCIQCDCHRILRQSCLH
jgi:hypothetical protein